MKLRNIANSLFTSVLLVSTTTVRPCPPDSPEIKLFRTEFCAALRGYAGREITGVIKKHRTSLCAIDIYMALLVGQGYILGQLTLKRHLLETCAITASKEKDATIQEVNALKHTYADLKKMIHLVNNEDQDIFEIFSQSYSVQYYHALLTAIQNLSVTDVKNAIEKYHPHQLPMALDEQLVTPLKLATLYVAALAELKRSESNSSLELDVLKKIQLLLEQEEELRAEEPLADSFS